MEKEILAIFIAVAIVGLIGFVADAELTGNWFKAPRFHSSGGSPFSSYRPPQQAYSVPQQPVQPASQPQIIPQQFFGTLVNNYINVQKDKSFCLANCAQTIKGNCVGSGAGPYTKTGHVSDKLLKRPSGCLS